MDNALRSHQVLHDLAEPEPDHRADALDAYETRLDKEALIAECLATRTGLLYRALGRLGFEEALTLATVYLPSHKINNEEWVAQSSRGVIMTRDFKSPFRETTFRVDLQDLFTFRTAHMMAQHYGAESGTDIEALDALIVEVIKQGLRDWIDGHVEELMAAEGLA